MDGRAPWRAVVDAAKRFPLFGSVCGWSGVERVWKVHLMASSVHSVAMNSLVSFATEYTEITEGREQVA